MSPYMDRNNTDQPKMSLNFIDYMVLPMLTALKKLSPHINECVEQLHKNRAIWAERSASEVVTVESVLEDYKHRSPSPGTRSPSPSLDSEGTVSTSHSQTNGHSDMLTPPPATANGRRKPLPIATHLSMENLKRTQQTQPPAPGGSPGNKKSVSKAKSKTDLPKIK